MPDTETYISVDKIKTLNLDLDVPSEQNNFKATLSYRCDLLEFLIGLHEASDKSLNN